MEPLCLHSRLPATAARQWVGPGTSASWFVAGIAALLALIPILHASANAELPRKAPLSKYSGLWVNSPFTSRPVITAPDATPDVNPLDDYSLIGVAPVGDGYRVTLINRNDPTERITVDSSRPNGKSDFKILGIDRQPGRPLATSVRLSKGSTTGTVRFEQELLSLAPPPAAQQPQQANLPPGINLGDAQTNQTQGNRRQPRPRVVPPPANGQQQQQQQGADQRSRIPSPQGTQGRADRRARR